MNGKTNGQRTKNLFNPSSDEPFKLSRSKLELFTECPRCFYLDRRLGVGRPQGPGFTLNAAVDHLLKKEFDVHRAAGSAHPLMEAYGIDAVPFQHEMLAEWRENFKGVQYLDRDNNLIITGAIDDVWINPKKELMVVDYKNGRKDKEAFDANLEFRVQIIPYKGDDKWVPVTILAAKKCLLGDLPPPGARCEYCFYRSAAEKYENQL